MYVYVRIERNCTACGTTNDSSVCLVCNMVDVEIEGNNSGLNHLQHSILATNSVLS